MNRRAREPLKEWPTMQRPEPFRMSRIDHARNVLDIIGAVLIVILAAAWMGAVIEAVPA